MIELNFTPLFHQAISVVIIILALGIFWRANYIYEKEPCKNLIFIAAGFLLGGIFELIHTCYAYLYDYVHSTIFYQNIEFLYVIISRIFTSSSILISSFFIQNSTKKNKNSFRRKVYFGYFSVALLLVVAIEVALRFFPNVSNIYTNTLIINNPSLEIINNGLFLLSALIYIDIREINNKPRISPFIFGLLFLALGQIYLYSVAYTQSFYRLYIHFSRITGYIFVLFGLKDATLKAEYFSLRQKIIIYPSILLMLLYLIINTTSIVIYGRNVADSFKYIFTTFYIISILLAYYFSYVSIKPLEKLIFEINNLAPGENPKILETNTNDEIGVLTAKLNEYAQNDWKNLQKAKLEAKRGQKSAQREALLRKIAEKIRSSFDKGEVLDFICEETAKLFNLQRATIIEFNDPEETLDYIVRKEYKSSPDITGVVETDKIPLLSNFWNKILLKENKILAIDNIDKSNTPDFFKETYQELGVKSIIGISIKIKEGSWLTLVLSEYNYYRHWSKEDKKLLQAITSQATTALYQIKLFEQQKKAAEREKLIRDITQRIRSSLKIDDTLNFICNEVGKLFNVQRSAITTFPDKNNYQNFEIKMEYKTSQEIKGFVSKEYAANAATFWGKSLMNNIDIVAFDNIPESNTPDYFKQCYKDMGVKSIIGVAIKKEDDIWGTLVLAEYNYFRRWTNEDKEVLKTISEQIYIAIEQSELYESTKRYAELFDTASDSIMLLDEKGFFDCNKMTLEIFGCKTKEDFLKLHPGDFSPEFQPNGENSYELANKKINYAFEHGYNRFDWTHKRLDNNRDFPAEVILKVIESGTKQVLQATVRDITERKHLFEELQKKAEKEAQLYEIQKKTAYRESVLREVISEIKLTRNLDQAYNKLLKKITEVFGLNRTIFLESSETNPQELKIKYEYVIDREDLSVNNLVFPQVCREEFFRLVHNLESLIINDVSKCHPEKTHDFFNKYKIGSLLAVPLVKTNKEVRVFGFIVLCSEYPRIWNDEEVTLIKSISDSVVSVIWEIANFNEIENLRNTFILTLAHDIQVPLVGEKIALEYLLKTSNEKSREIVNELIESNKNISVLLNKSMDIYNYEAGKKALEKNKYDLVSVVNELIDSEEEYCQRKGVNISTQQHKSLFVKIDKTEITKAIKTIIENAIEYTEKEDDVIVRFSETPNRAIVSIHNRSYIPPEIQEIIFKRYEMALSTKRKIGGGIGLFLSKKIIEGHDGFLWFETSKEKGTTFYISLGLIK